MSSQTNEHSHQFKQKDILKAFQSYHYYQQSRIVGIVTRPIVPAAELTPVGNCSSDGEDSNAEDSDGDNPDGALDNCVVANVTTEKKEIMEISLIL